jgi:hypothetical protein
MSPTPTMAETIFSWVNKAPLAIQKEEDNDDENNDKVNR